MLTRRAQFSNERKQQKDARALTVEGSWSRQGTLFLTANRSANRGPLQRTLPFKRRRRAVGCEAKEKKRVVCLCFCSHGTLSFHARDNQAFSYLIFSLAVESAESFLTISRYQEKIQLNA